MTHIVNFDNNYKNIHIFNKIIKTKLIKYYTCIKFTNFLPNFTQVMLSLIYNFPLISHLKKPFIFVLPTI